MYIVYALIDPIDGLIRYIGLTEDVYARFMQHLSCEGSNQEKNAWVKCCRAANAMIQMRNIDSSADRQEALMLERKWIEHYSEIGMPLFNIRGTSDWRRLKPQISPILELGREDRLQKVLETYQPGMGLREQAKILCVSKDTLAGLRRELMWRGLIQEEKISKLG